MKKLLLILIFVLTISITNADAFSWRVYCENLSCEASGGGVKVMWSAYAWDDIYKGTLTGIQGLPVNIEDFQEAQKRAEQTIEKILSVKKSYLTIIGLSQSEIGTRTESGKEQAISKRRSMSQSETQTRRIRIDYTLNFVKRLGDSLYASYAPDDMRRYIHAVEVIVTTYTQDPNALYELIDAYMISQQLQDFSEASLILSKAVDELVFNMKSASAFEIAAYLSASEKGFQTPYDSPEKIPSQITKDDILKSFIIYARAAKDSYENIYEMFKKITAPGETALNLHQKGEIVLAYAKWFADTKLKHITDPDFRYLTAIHYARLHPADMENPKDYIKLKRDYTEFEQAIEKRDKSVKLVTVKRTIPWKYAVFLLPAVLVVAFFAVKKLKKHKTRG